VTLSDDLAGAEASLKFLF